MTQRYFLIYKLTNTMNGKIYVGCHITKNVDDGYMGSGRRLGYAKKKYGVENFKKEILKVCETVDEMLAEEKKIVDEEFLRRGDVYNLNVGGRGGWFVTNSDPEKVRARNLKCAQKLKERVKNDLDFKRKLSEINRKNNKKAYALGRHARNLIPGWNRSSGHSESSKRKIGAANSIHQAGSGNSAFGTAWISSREKSVRVKLDQVQHLLDLGWIRGRAFIGVVP